MATTTTSQGKYARRKESGTCFGCSKPPKAGHIYCEQCLENHRRYSKAKKEERIAQGLCVDCGKMPALPGITTCEVHRDKRRLFAKGPTAQQWKQNLKDEVYAAYGGYRCACCGEEEPLFLTVDHVNNDGAAHRRTITNGRKNPKTGGPAPNNSYEVYLWLKRNGFPEGYQILCHNCNTGKHRNGGVCPHQQRR